MNKRLIRNEQDYNDFKDFESENGKINWFLSSPDFYPCLALYETRTSDNGWDYISGDFAYIMDFEGLAVYPRAAMEDE